MKNVKNTEKLEQIQLEKIKLTSVRVTTFLSGKNKNAFLNDCILRGATESDVAREIIKLHYYFVEHHNLKGADFDKIKKTLNQEG